LAVNRRADTWSAGQKLDESGVNNSSISTSSPLIMSNSDFVSAMMRQYCAFARNSVGQHVIEGRDTVTGDNQELALIFGGIHIPDFTLA
jgi:hypothetical protein